MEWIKIDKSNLPDNEVIAANFQILTYGYKEKLLGYISIQDDEIICENDNEILQNCTHYIDINKYDL